MLRHYLILDGLARLMRFAAEILIITAIARLWKLFDNQPSFTQVPVTVAEADNEGGDNHALDENHPVELELSDNRVADDCEEGPEIRYQIN